MAFHPDVHEGDEFRPSAALSNDVRRLVNSLNGFGGGAVPGTSSGNVRIQICNASPHPLNRGTAVIFTGLSETGDIAEAVPYAGTGGNWGVTVQRLGPGEIGDCVISGPVSVALAGTGTHARPDAGSPAVFTAGNEGAPVLCSGGGRAIVNIGAGNSESYDGPFAVAWDAAAGKLRVASGFLSRNGEFLRTPPCSIPPAEGHVCVESRLLTSGWTEPEVKIAEPSVTAFPVAGCHVVRNGGVTGVSVVQYRVPVAVIIVADECPLSAAADGEDADA